MISRLAPWLLCATCACPALLHAQTATTGSIGGFVYDQQHGALAGVTITATSPDVPGTRETVSTATGAYRLTDLPPGTYTLNAEHPGFARFTQHNIRVGAGLNLGLQIVLQLADVNETVEVRHDPPLLEVLRPGQTHNISGDFQRSVPLNRNGEWADFMQLIPGVTTNVDAPSRQGYFFHGADQGSHVFQLDGADVTAARSFNGFTALSTNAIADVRVASAIADASAPLGLGAITNVVTRSGADSFRGDGRLVYQHRDWNDSNVKGGTSSATSLFQPDAALGGPIRRGRAWFFGSYQYRDATTAIARSAEVVANLQVASEAALGAPFVPFDNTNRTSFFLGKVTQRVRAAEVTLSAQYDRNPSTTDSFDKLHPVDTPFVVGGSWYSGRVALPLGSHWQARFAVTYNAKRAESGDFATPHLPSRRIFSLVQPSGGRLAGVTLLGIANNNPGRRLATPDNKLTLAADVSHAGWETALGTHGLQAGWYLQRNRQGRREELVDRLFLSEEVLRNPSRPSDGTIEFHRSYGSPDSLWTTDDRAYDVAAYVQDVWRMGPRVTLTAGLRVDRISRTDLLFDVGNQHSVEIGPRLGVTTTLDAEQRHVLHGGVGRTHEALHQTALSELGLGGPTFTFEDSYDLDLDGVFETTLTTPGQSTLAPGRRLDPDRHQPFVDDVSVGYRWQAAPLTSVDVTWLRRTFRDSITNIEVNGIYDGNVFRGYQDESQNAILLMTNNRWNRLVYNDLLVQVARQGRRIQLIGSYTRQWKRLAGTWQPNDPSSFLQPESFADDRAIPLSWRDHAVRLAAHTVLPRGWWAAGDYTIQSGQWSGPVTTRLPAADPAFGPPTITLSNGRVVSNPLATTTRFAFATRGEGQLQSSPLRTLNVVIGKEIPVGNVKGVVSVQVFNLLNEDGPQGFVSTDQTSTNFGIPRSFQLPRVAQLSVKVAF